MHIVDATAGIRSCYAVSKRYIGQPFHRFIELNVFPKTSLGESSLQTPSELVFQRSEKSRHHAGPQVPRQSFQHLTRMEAKCAQVRSHQHLDPALPRNALPKPYDNPFIPGKRQLALIAISMMVAIERHATEPLLPFRLGLVCGIVPPECLIWSFIILEMAVRDVCQLYCDVKE